MSDEALIEVWAHNVKVAALRERTLLRNPCGFMKKKKKITDGTTVQFASAVLQKNERQKKKAWKIQDPYFVVHIFVVFSF